MGNVITRVKLHNFRRFSSLSLNLGPEKCILIGDNESGKSTVLQAIDLIASGSRSKVETIGIDSLMHVGAVKEFMLGTKQFSQLPILWAELYLSEQNNPDLNGRNNSEKVLYDGLSLMCSPMEEYSEEIREYLTEDDSIFPYEYYSIKFQTFSGESYTGYRQFLRHLLLDSSQINNEYATREYIKSVYRANAEDKERIKHQTEYRKHKEQFRR